MTSNIDSSRLMARMAAEIVYDDLPVQAVEATRNDLLDTLGVAIAGRAAPGCREVCSLVLGNYGADQATVWGSGRKAAAAEAAWANGTMAHALDFDDTHDPSVLHAGVSVIPAALAAAELTGGISGREFIAAVTIGLDWVCRMGVATTVGPVASGWMYTSLFGFFGATAAVGRVMKLDADQMAHAIGITYAQAAGNTQCMIDGSLTKRMQPGFAARAAVTSAMLARAGITGTINSFDGQSGLFRICLDGRYDRDVLLHRLGEHFHGAELSFKPYPACRYTHPAIEATLDMMKESRIEAGTIEHIDVGVNEHAFGNVCTPLEVKTRPRTIVDAQFSIPFCIATAIVKGEVFVPHFTAEALRDEEVLEVAAKVRPAVDPAIQASHGREISPVAISIRLKNGESRTRYLETAKGGIDNPMSFDELAAKVRQCATYAGFQPTHPMAERLIGLTRTLETLPDVRALATAMADSPE